MSFYEKHFQHKVIQNLDTILTLHGADGHELPYEGFIEADITAPGLNSDDNFPCIFLVVPTTEYHETAPLLLGTNILRVLLEHTKSNHGIRFLQEAKLHTPWFLAFRCLTLRDKEQQIRSRQISRNNQNYYPTK